MQIIQNRRDFLASLSAAGGSGRPRRPGIARRRGAAGGDHDPAAPRSRASASRPGTSPRICCARKASPMSATCGARIGPARHDRARRDRLRPHFAPAVVFRLDAGVPITVLAGVHAGCFELFAHEPIRTISDLKGKKVGVPRCWRRVRTCTSRSWRRMSGSTPRRTSTGSTPVPTGQPRWSCSPDGRVDAFLGFPPEPQELRARKIGRVILNIDHGQAVVAVFLLHARGKQGLRPQLPDRDQARAARHPQGGRHLRRRAGAGRAASGRCAGSRSATTTRCRR